MRDRSLDSLLATRWVRPWKDLKDLKSGLRKCGPAGAISEKPVKSRMTRCRLVQLQNRSPYVGALMKAT